MANIPSVIHTTPTMGLSSAVVKKLTTLIHYHVVKMINFNRMVHVLQHIDLISQKTPHAKSVYVLCILKWIKNKKFKNCRFNKKKQRHQKSNFTGYFFPNVKTIDKKNRPQTDRST